MTMQGHGVGHRRRDSADRRRARPLAISRLRRLLDGAEVLERDVHGVKVARMPSGRMMKLFRRKRRLSSAAWRPYAQRFVDNAEGLARRGVPTVQVLALFACPEAARHVVMYRPLEGEVLRDRVSRGEAPDWAALARFVALLHKRGVYFRSLHGGNIVCVDGGGFGLIDIADLQLLRRPLGVARRLRNLRPLLRDPSLQALRQRAPFEEFIEAYRQAASLSAVPDALFPRLAWRRWARFGVQGSGDGVSGAASPAGNR